MGGKGKDVISSDDPEPCRMRVRARQDDHPPPPSNANPNLAGETSQKRPRLEAGVSREHKGDGPVSSLRSQGIMIDEPSLPQPSFGKAANQDLLQRPLTRQTTTEVVPPQTCNISDRAGQTSSHLNHRQIKTPNQVNEAGLVQVLISTLVIYKKMTNDLCRIKGIIPSFLKSQKLNQALSFYKSITQVTVLLIQSVLRMSRVNMTHQYLKLLLQ